MGYLSDLVSGVEQVMVLRDETGHSDVDMIGRFFRVEGIGYRPLRC